jgi:hypothetical protein
MGQVSQVAREDDFDEYHSYLLHMGSSLSDRVNKGDLVSAE